jgi:hypothetical protein
MPVEQGTETTKLDGFQTLTVKSTTVTLKGTPEHTVVTRKTNRGKVQTSSKKYPATGAVYYGYWVGVYVGSTLIDEIYSQPSLKRYN